MINGIVGAINIGIFHASDVSSEIDSVVDMVRFVSKYEGGFTPLYMCVCSI